MPFFKEDNGNILPIRYRRRIKRENKSGDVMGSKNDASGKEVFL